MWHPSRKLLPQKRSRQKEPTAVYLWNRGSPQSPVRAGGPRCQLRPSDPSQMALRQGSQSRGKSLHHRTPEAGAAPGWHTWKGCTCTLSTEELPSGLKHLRILPRHCLHGGSRRNRRVLGSEPSVGESAGIPLRLNEMSNCRTLSSGSPERTVHSPRSRGPALPCASAAPAWHEGVRVWGPGQLVAGCTSGCWEQ